MNAKPRRFLSRITPDFEADYRGDLRIIYGEEPGTVVFECEVMNPRSSRGRTIYVYFQADDLTDAMKVLRDEAIRLRSKPMVPTESALPPDESPLAGVPTMNLLERS